MKQYYTKAMQNLVLHYGKSFFVYSYHETPIGLQKYDAWIEAHLGAFGLAMDWELPWP